MIFPTFELESSCEGYQGHVIGVDEVGRGPLAGPVVAAAVRWRGTTYHLSRGEDQYTRLIRDSKTLSSKQRETAFAWIADHFDIGTAQIDSEEIDRINILQASLKAMHQAATHCFEKFQKDKGIEKSSFLLLIDGNQKIPESLFAQKTIIGGDAHSRTIAAASIVAKVLRDRIMETFDAKYPEYGFARHKGYGTAMHLEALRRWGSSPIHRRSFAPVARVSARICQSS